MIKRWSIFFLISLFVVGCGSSDQPDSRVLNSELEKSLFGLATVDSIKLEKTGQDGNASIYAVQGNAKLNQNLYKHVVFLPGKEIVAPYKSKGDKIPLTATLKTKSNSGSGWDIEYSDVAMDLVMPG